MLKFRAEAFYRTTMALGNTSGSINLMHGILKERGEKHKITSDNLAGTKVVLEQLEAHLHELHTPLALIELKRMLSDIDTLGTQLTYKNIQEKWSNIDSRLHDELSLISVYILDANLKKYADIDTPSFGTDVADRLPMAISDIEDAGKCLAFSQGTASVFHSMRVMEAALKALGRLMDIPYAPSWEAYIVQIENKINAKHKTKGIQWKRDEPFYREILGNLQTIKIAWRNPTMHIVRRYSAAEAEEIYVAVRAFLKRLAPKLPKPKIPKVLLEAQ